MNSQVETEFYRYLLSLGFPPTAVIYEPAFKPSAGGRRFRPDFAVLDPKTREILAIIELKGTALMGRLEEALAQVDQYAKQIGDSSVRAYVATPANESFVFYQAGEDGTPKVVDPAFLAAPALASAKSAEQKEALSQKKKRTIDAFFVVCYFTAAAAVALGVADYFMKKHGVSVLTPERLALLAAAAGLLILPFLQKFKALGVEIERQAAKTDG